MSPSINNKAHYLSKYSIVYDHFGFFDAKPLISRLETCNLYMYMYKSTIVHIEFYCSIFLTKYFQMYWIVIVLLFVTTKKNGWFLFFCVCVCVCEVCIDCTKTNISYVLYIGFVDLCRFKSIFCFESYTYWYKENNTLKKKKNTYQWES